MVLKNVSFKLDGTTKFTVDDTYIWKNGQLDYVEVRSSKDITVSIDLSGSNWSVSKLLVSGSANLAVDIDDSARGTNRTIETMTLHGLGGSVVQLAQTHVDQFDGGNANDRIATGAGGIDMIDLKGGNNSVTVGSAAIEGIFALGGRDIVAGGAGAIDVITLGNGNNTVTGGAGNIGAVMLGANDDTVVVNNGAMDVIHLGRGDNTVTMKGRGNVDAIVGLGGNDTVTITGSGDVGTINVGHGNNTVTTGDDGSVSCIVAYDGDQTIKTGSTGVRIIRLSNGESSVDAGGAVNLLIAGVGNKNFDFHSTVGSIDIGDGINKLDFYGLWVDSVAITNGTDTVTLHGTNAESINTGGGNDKLICGSGKIGAAQMGAGNDIVYYSDMKLANTSSYIDGGGSIDPKTGENYSDTINFSRFKHGGVTISIATSDNQDTGAGGIQLSRFENITGSAGGDTLSGNRQNNVIDGGAGNDSLFGWAGADTFVYSKGNDLDTITDFTLADDKVDLTGEPGITSFSELKTHMTRSGSDVVISFDVGDALTIENVTIGQLTADQFVL